MIELVNEVAVKALRGPAPAVLPVHRRVKRAEMWAFYKLLQNALPPIQAVTDHLAIVQGLERGRAWCTAPRRAHADLWRLIWDVWDDLGGHEAGNVARHCKAHRSKAQLATLSGQQRQDALCNAEADRWAKAGAACDAGFGRDQALVEATAQTKEAVQYILEWHEQNPTWEDVTPKAVWEAEAKERKAGMAGPPRGQKRPRHEVMPFYKLDGEQGGWRCNSCRRWTCGPSRGPVAGLGLGPSCKPLPAGSAGGSRATLSWPTVRCFGA